MVAAAYSYNDTEIDFLDGTVDGVPPNWTLSAGISGVGGADGFIYQNSISPQQGSTCGNILSNATGRQFVRRDLGAGNTFNMLTNDITWWFFYVKGKGDQILTDVPGTGEWPVSLRVYSDATPGANWAEWDLAGNDTLQAAWNFLTVSGDTPSRTGGTGVTYTAIRHLEFRFDFARSTEGGFTTGDEPIALDFIKYGNTITITGGDGADPDADYAGLFAWSEGDPADRVNDPAYGLVIKEDVFNSILAAVDFGNGTAATVFTDINQFVLNRTFSDTVRHDIRVRNNATVTLGTKDVGSQDTYAIEGVQIVTPSTAEDGSTGLPTSDFIVQSGGTLNIYNSKIFRYDQVEFLSGCTVDGLEVDFADNDFVVIADTDVTLLNCKIHDNTGLGYAGEISAAATITGTQIFNQTRGLRFTASITVENYIATDNSDSDIVVENLLTVTLDDSTFDRQKIRRV